MGSESACLCLISSMDGGLSLDVPTHNIGRDCFKSCASIQKYIRINLIYSG